MDATWHSGPRGSATRAHAALCDRFIIHIYRKYMVIVHISLLIIGIMLTHIFDVPYIPACLL